MCVRVRIDSPGGRVTMRPKKSVLITSVGSLVGHTLLQTLAGRRDHLRLVGLNSRADEPSNFDCDVVWLTPETADGPLHLARLSQVMRKESVDLVIPSRDEDVVALANLRAREPELAPRLLVGSVGAAQAMDSKLASASFAAKNALPFAPTVASDAPDSRELVRALVVRYGFPLIAKPAHGNGSRGVLVLLNQDQLDRMLSRPAYVIQPMLDAPAKLGLDVADGIPLFWGVPEERLFAVRGLVGIDGKLGRNFGYVMTMVMGRAERMARVDDPLLDTIGLRFGQALSKLGWRGPYNVQCKRDTSAELIPIEINGRFGGGTAGRRELGYDELAWAVNQWLGGDFVPLDSPGEWQSDLVVSKLADYALPHRPLQTLAERGQWPPHPG